ncbi:hypothetical protein MO867_19330 [Microbulbifer sp. OS29]|uniref:Glycosyl transferase family 2 n=1 Tax=Microbulbifer okhotskensis TaxID=2926617 RepID=A0A9X2EV47_9GAMM|nr:hypothetical protein [Microbulbifer okhotskensis]MCO1336488.1 hypothetical protein [Microbulbifer okhotskensis]
MSMISIVIISGTSVSNLGACLQSILRQQCKDIEILVLSLSTENENVQLVNTFRDYFTGFRFICVPDTPQINSQFIFELGLKNTLGDYIGFIDESDCFCPTILGKLSSIADSHQPDIIFFSHNNDALDLAGNYDNESNRAAKKNLLKSDPDKLRKLYRRDFSSGKNLSKYTMESCVQSHSLHWVSTLKAVSMSIIPAVGSYNLADLNEFENEGKFQQIADQYLLLFDYINITFVEYKYDLLVSWLLYLLRLRPLHGDKKIAALCIKSNFLSRYKEQDFYKVTESLNLGKGERNLLREWYSYCNKKKFRVPHVLNQLLPVQLYQYAKNNDSGNVLQKLFDRIYFRLPDTIKLLVDFPKKNIRKRVSNRELLEALESLTKQSKFDRYMSMINEDCEKKITKHLSEIKQELTQLKNSKFTENLD